MSRVSEKSNVASLEFSMGKTKGKIEDLQIKGSNLKRMIKPSDDPRGNVELLFLRTQNKDNEQFIRNTRFASILLDYTEKSMEEGLNIMVKAKELAVGQSSDLHNKEVRNSVAKEINQLHKQLVSIANRRMGNRYIFGGYKTLSRPFNAQGEYLGDSKNIYAEIQKDFFIPTNIPGDQVFFLNPSAKLPEDNPLQRFPSSQIKALYPASNDVSKEQENLTTQEQKDTIQVSLNSDAFDLTTHEKKESLFSMLKSFETALISNDAESIQNLLEPLDMAIDHIIGIRTKVGTVMNTLSSNEISIEDDQLYNAKKKSEIEDADVAELFSDLYKQENILKATYKSGKNLLQQSLLNFIN